MKEATRIQIENMKNQTFGVEIEGNNITRKKAAEKAAAYFGTGRSEYTAGRNGYMTWSAWPILTYADMELLQGLVRVLRKAGMKSDAGRGCGVHIHIGAKGHTPQTIRNLVNIMAAHESQIAKAIKVDSWRQSRYCRTVDPRFLEQVNRKKPSTMSQLADVWYESQGCGNGRTQHYNQSRYRMANLHALFTKGTIEFRLFQFDAPADGKQNGLHAGHLKAMIQLCLAMSQLARQIRFASPKPQQTENEAYAFRCWMLRLGFIGEEFKTARDFFLANMDGNCAWRHSER